MSMFIFDIHNRGSFVESIGVESESEKQAVDCARKEFPQNTITFIRKINKQFQVVETEDKFAYNFARFKRIQNDYGFKSVWSKYDVDNIDDLAPFTFNRIELDHVPTAHTKIPLENHTWLEIWSVVDKLISEYDPGHPYIEGFRVSKNTLYVTTGS